ncbi:HNH endonuclease [Leptolyngbya sp. AN02str]|uniref:HNH endonuclease n=1 Tax=Leptolyngbya sp. AN02str TaxID=3423363 RepID=UPI003D30F632
MSDDIEFDRKDLEVFKIPDLKTRLDTLQHYFFPRLEKLLVNTVELIQQIYDVNPYERMSFQYTPSHRKEAKSYKYFECVCVGLGGRRNYGKKLKIKKPNGEFYSIHRASLNFRIEPNGRIYTILHLCGGLDAAVNQRFFENFRYFIDRNWLLLNRVFELHCITHGFRFDMLSFKQSFSPKYLHLQSDSYINLYSPHFYFPTDLNYGLQELQLAFICLYPLLDASLDIEVGRRPKLSKMLKQYLSWYFNDSSPYLAQSEKVSTELISFDLPELDSYTFVRPGLWWSVLARDKWTCMSCGRSAKDGITLHVDHILPRSLGGSNDMENLQTLCWKCNIGKSNKDSTNLRI